MRMTAYDLIQRSLKNAGVLANGDPEDDDSSSDALQQLNLMVESLRVEKYIAPGIDRIVFNAVPGKIAYAIGPSPVLPEQDITIGGVDLRNLPLVINNYSWGIDTYIPVPIPGTKVPMALVDQMLTINGVVWTQTPPIDWPTPFTVVWGSTPYYPSSPVNPNPDMATMAVTVDGMGCSVIPDIITPADVLDITTARVLIGNTVWKPLRKIDTLAYYNNAQAVVSRIPDTFAYVRNFPVSFFTLWAYPSGTYPIEITYSKSLEVTNLYDPLPYPDGYYDAFSWGLAVQLAPSYGIDETPLLYRWEQRKANLKRMLRTTPILHAGDAPGRYWIYTDSIVRSNF